MTPQPLREVLSPDQDYVLHACTDLGIEACGVRHAIATSTCLEKAHLLHWPPWRVVKALYFSDRANWIGVVMPELSCRLDRRRLFTVLFGMSRRTADGFNLGLCPPGMEPGTCSPFPWRTCLLPPVPMIRHIVVHRDAATADEQVDISVGGTGPGAHLLSAHLPYRALYDILAHSFRARVCLVDLTPYLLPTANLDLDPPLAAPARAAAATLPDADGCYAPASAID